MSVFSDAWDAFLKYNPITLAGNAASDVFGQLANSMGPLDWITPRGLTNTLQGPPAPNPVPRPPALSESDAISNFRQGERDSLGGGSSSDMPSITEILARLEQMQDPSRYFQNYDALMNEARGQAAAQYDPVISQLRNAMGQAESRGNRNREALGQMFGQLSDSLAAEIPGIEQKYRDTEAAQNSQFDQLKNTINQTYQNTQADQEAMLKRLNIEAAAPTTLANQQRDQAYFTNRANVDQQTANTALQQEGRGNVEYTRRGSDVAKVEGAQRQADLMTQLQDVLNAYQNQIGANEAAKGSAVQSIFNQLSRQATDDAFKYSQRDFDNYLASIKLGSELRKDQLTANPYPTQVKSITDVPGRAIGMGLSPQAAQNLYSIFSSAVGGDDRILKGINPDSGTPLSKEQLANYIREAGIQQGLSQPEVNALQAIALEYFGRA